MNAKLAKKIRREVKSQMGNIGLDLHYTTERFNPYTFHIHPDCQKYYIHLVKRKIRNMRE